MTTNNFATRHGYQPRQQELNEKDYLPREVRQRAGMMLINRLDDFYEAQEFVETVQDLLPASAELWEWYDTIPIPSLCPDELFATMPGLDEHNWSSARSHLVQPLLSCDWLLFYAVIEQVCTKWRCTETPNDQTRVEWRSTGATRIDSFEANFNLLLASHGIPWVMRSGLIIPVEDLEYTDELKWVREDGPLSNADEGRDPRVSLNMAFEALYRKDRGVDITGACHYAWHAWEVAKKAAGGHAAVERNYPEMWAAITAWQKLIHAGRHLGKAKVGRAPTETETKFIVCLLTNSVRLINPDSDTP